jgi:hypothetical protein
MKHPDEVARLREIKRLLERIQMLPRIAAMPVQGRMIGPKYEPAAHHAAPANGFHNGLAGRSVGGHAEAKLGPPHPADELDPAPELAPAPASLPPLDPLPPPLDPARRKNGRGDYWATERIDDAGTESRALVPTRLPPASGLGISPWLFIAATTVNTIVAAVMAVVITLGVSRRETPPPEAEKVAVVVRPAAETQPERPAPRPLELLPVGSPGEPLRLEALKPARLPFEVRPEESVQDSFTLRLTGLPPNATISGAIPLDTDSWRLPPGALQRLEITVPEWSATVFEVGVELRRTNGEVAARTKLWLAVPPPPTPTGAALDEAELKNLVRTGDQLFSRGDVAAARVIYQKAAAMGSAQAALAMGTTYDQPRLWALGVFGMVGNKERARQWYQRADELGHPEAKARITALQ